MATTDRTIRSTATITRTDPAAPRGLRRHLDAVHRRFLPTLALAASIALIGLAVPRTIAAWEAMTATATLEMLRMGSPVQAKDLAAGGAALRNALKWQSTAGRFTDLALLEMLEASDLPGASAAREQKLAEAEWHVTTGLAANPANPYAWFWLAIVKEMRDAPPRDVAAALVQSLDVGPNARNLWIPRAGMLLSYWRNLNVDELLAMRAHLHSIWIANNALRLPLLEAAVRAGQVPMLGWALGNDPEAELEFNKLRHTLSK
jgi:hypothetical protein